MSGSFTRIFQALAFQGRLFQQRRNHKIQIFLTDKGFQWAWISTGASLHRLDLYASNLSFYVKNAGSATQPNVRFMSFKPENWNVEFAPEKIDAIAPGEIKQVEVTITPADQALVGDYSVGLAVEGGKVTKNLELRTTVRASTAWGGIGIGIIVLVVAGLVVLFIRMGRR